MTDYERFIPEHLRDEYLIRRAPARPFCAYRRSSAVQGAWHSLTYVAHSDDIRELAEKIEKHHRESQK